MINLINEPITELLNYVGSIGLVVIVNACIYNGKLANIG